MSDEPEPMDQDLARDGMADAGGLDRDVAEPMQGQVLGEEEELGYRDLEEGDKPGIDVEDVPEADKKRKGFLWWLGMSALSLLVIVLGLGVMGVVLYNFGTMETPSADIQGQYQQLVDSGQAAPLATPSGFHIPIPGCRCHAADPDIATKDPGRQPDVSLVMAHQYRTISQCGKCHGGSEPKGVEGQPLEDAPAQ